MIAVQFRVINEIVEDHEPGNVAGGLQVRPQGKAGFLVLQQCVSSLKQRLCLRSCRWSAAPARRRGLSSTPRCRRAMATRGETDTTDPPPPLLQICLEAFSTPDAALVHSPPRLVIFLPRLVYPCLLKHPMLIHLSTTWFKRRVLPGPAMRTTGSGGRSTG